MRKRNTQRLLEGFEKKDDVANRTKDTLEKVGLVLQPWREFNSLISCGTSAYLPICITGFVSCYHWNIITETELTHWINHHFFRKMRKLISNEKVHFESSFRSWDNQILNFEIFMCHDVIKCLNMKHETYFIE